MVIKQGVNGLIDVSMLALILGVMVYTVWLVKNPKGSMERQDEEMRLICNAVLTIGVLAWPVVFDATIGIDSLFKEPRLLLGFAWPVALLMTDLQFVTKFSTATGQKGRATALFQQADLKSDTSSIMYAAFAMGSLLFSSNKNFTVTHIIMYAMVMCLGFVVPTLQVPPETKEALLWRCMQRVVMTWAIGFVVSGISTDLLTKLFNDQGKKVEAEPMPVRIVTEATPAAKALTGGGLVFRDLPLLNDATKIK